MRKYHSLGTIGGICILSSVLFSPAVFASTNSSSNSEGFKAPIPIGATTNLSKPVPSVLAALEKVSKANKENAAAIPSTTPETFTSSFNEELISDAETMQQDYQNNLSHYEQTGLYTYAEAVAAAESDTAYQFALNEKQGGIWDIKQTLGYSSTYTYGGHVFTGDDLGNIHYAYVGRAAGFTAIELESIGGIVQLIHNHGNVPTSWFSSYFDEPSDDIAIKNGVNLWNADGLDLGSSPWEDINVLSS